MENRLAEPYCTFYPDEWESDTDLPPPESDLEDWSACYYQQESDKDCPIHRDVSKVTVEEMSNEVLEHCQSSPSDPEIQRLYNTLVGVELPGLLLNGRTLRASHNNEIDIRYAISHGDVQFTGSDIVSKLGMRTSLFSGAFEASQTTFIKNTTFDGSYFEQGAVFNQARFEEGVSFRGSTIEGDLDLSGVTVTGRLNLQDATVEGDVVLAGATINGDVVLEETDIKGDLDLTYATVTGAVRANKTDIGSVSLFSTRIVGPWLAAQFQSDDVTWTNSRFESSVIFVDCTICGSFEGYEVTIEEGIRWHETTATGSVKFRDSQFKHVSAFKQSEVGESFDIRNSDMEHHFRLHEMEVEEDIVLAGTELGSYTLLQEVAIGDDLRADSANAAGVFRSIDLNVNGKTNLTDLAVDEHLEFRTCSFGGAVDLEKSVVHEYVQFYGSCFDDELTARNSRIERNFEITKCTCTESVVLTGARIGTLFFDSETKTDSLLLEKVHVTERVAVLNGVSVSGTLSLDDAQLREGIQLASATVGNLQMSNSEFGGVFLGKDLTVGTPNAGGSLVADGTTVTGELRLEEATVYGELDFDSAKIEQETSIDRLRVSDTFSLSNAHLFGTTGGSGTNIGGLNLTGVTFEAGVLFHKATIQGNVDASQLTSTGPNVSFTRSRIRGAVSIQNADINGDFVVTDCWIGGFDVPDSILVDRASDKVEPPAALNLAATSIGTAFLIEDSFLRGTVFGTAASFGSVTLDETTISGDYRIDETEIDQTLKVTDTSVFGAVDGSDLRLGSKCEVTDLSTQRLDFTDSLFKWNVTISESVVGEATLENATFQNVLRLQRLMASDAPVRLNHAQVTEISITWAPGSTTVECEQAQLGNLNTTVPVPKRLWDRLHINRTQFNEFDFADFTASLSETNHLIHRDDRRSLFNRYRAFFPTLARNMRRLRRGNMDKRIKSYEDREVTYRRAKDSADTTGDNPAASKFYMHEKKYRRRRRFWAIFTNRGSRLRNFVAWTTNLSLGVLAGHGERASQVLVSAIAVVALFGVMLRVAAPVTEIEIAGILPALEQSLRTFVGAPAIINELPPFIEQLLLLERGLGIAFVPLLVFALTRSLHR